MTEYHFNEFKFIIRDDVIKNITHLIDEKKPEPTYRPVSFQIEEYDSNCKIPLLEIFSPVLVNIIFEYNMDIVSASYDGYENYAIFVSIESCIIGYRNMFVHTNFGNNDIDVRNYDMQCCEYMLTNHLFDKIDVMTDEDIHKMCTNISKNLYKNDIYFTLYGIISMFRHKQKMKTLVLLTLIYKLIMKGRVII